MRKYKLDHVKKELDKYIDDFYKDVKNKVIVDMLKNNIFIAGGAIYSLYNEEKPKDIDIFLTDEYLKTYIREYFEMNSSLNSKKNIKTGTYNPTGERILITDNAISLGRFQIITQWFGEPEEVVKDFDFKHNMYFYYNNEIKTLVEWSYLDDKKLRYNSKRARDIAGCICRVPKFLDRGFQMSSKEMANMVLDLHSKGFNDRELEILNNYNKRNNFGS